MTTNVVTDLVGKRVKVIRYDYGEARSPRYGTIRAVASGGPQFSLLLEWEGDPPRYGDQPGLGVITMVDGTYEVTVEITPVRQGAYPLDDEMRRR